MTVAQLIAILAQHNPDAEVRVCDATETGRRRPQGWQLATNPILPSFLTNEVAIAITKHTKHTKHGGA